MNFKVNKLVSKLKQVLKIKEQTDCQDYTLEIQSKESKPCGGHPLESLYFRRAVGILFKVRLEQTDTQAEIIAQRHGLQRRTTYTRTEIEKLMSLNQFKQIQDTDFSLIKSFENTDLVYYSKKEETRALSGCPIVNFSTQLCNFHAPSIRLRKNLRITLAIADKQEITPWKFMPRRGTLGNKKLVGLRFSSLESNKEVYVVDLLGSPEHGQLLRDLIPLLNGQWNGKKITEHAFKEHQTNHITNLLQWMNTLGLLETSKKNTQSQKRSDQVTWLGHACVLMQMAQANIIIDPLFFVPNDPTMNGEELLPDPCLLPIPDVILITHADNDHLNPSALLRFPRDTLIIIPACEEKHPYQVDPEEVLRFLGFTQIQSIRSWQTLCLSDFKNTSQKEIDVRITAAPFVGEDWGLYLPKATYIIQSPQHTLYFSADCAPMPEVYQRLGQTYTIDLAFLGVSGCQEPSICPPGFGYGEFYGLFLPKQTRNEWLHLCSNPQEAAEAAVQLNAKKVFGYAASGIATMPMAHSDQGSHQALALFIKENNIPVLCINLELGQTQEIT